jgi:HPt (histidine-containing phosphotransfer) domain-containing protein
MASDDQASPAGEFDNLLDGIDWSELQAFFFEHLLTQLEDMEAKLAAGDLTGLSRIGHSIKGSGGGVQLPRFTDLGKALEDSGKDGDLEACRLACQAIRDEYVTHRPNGAATVGGYFEPFSNQQEKKAA